MSWQKPKVMGVINVTPDSFSDGGQFLSLENALEQAKLLVSQGAEILDVGGESTRPGAGRITIQEEQARVLPVINAIKKELSVLVSIDTLNSETARRAIEAGADIVNDVSGGLADPAMSLAIAPTNCLYVLGHWRGFSDVMDERAQYSDVAREVVAELAEQVSMAVASGISRDRIIVDPGLGFAKDMQQNWDLVARLDELKKLELPILVGASRKRFIAHALDKENPQSVDHARRDVATAVLTALLLQRKLWGVRVHNVQTTVDAISVVAALKEAEDK
ncbi:MAG: dihydropteroate synthase [Actinobacteria bacterium]|uniref:dihydropteroate synthase n=1 Tax=freshwater metagenome TaxID=449393 RepID=A0A6J6C2K8_9ZZZZ|nr:dihydropteroate synthase [Actinomycetota bacterium]